MVSVSGKLITIVKIGKYEENAMSRKAMALWVFLAVPTLFAAANENMQPPAKLSAAEVAEKNVQARGGLKAWRAVRTWP